ncbi:MAG: hypothetical protein H7831_07235 [Magnetococcus sp. WYHC-3]
MSDSPALEDGAPPSRHTRIALIPPWMRLGMRAYVRAFSFRQGSSGRDFAWITMQLALVISLGLLLVGSRVGFLERLTDAMLGHLRPDGVPIWVTSHWENPIGVQSHMLRRIGTLETGGVVSKPVHPHPYRRLSDSDPYVQLPVSGVWGETLPFSAWAVYPTDPLWRLGTRGAGGPYRYTSTWEQFRASLAGMLGWQWSERAETQPAGGMPVAAESGAGATPWVGLPLDVVLSESVFLRHLDYARYRQGLKELIPDEEFRRLPLGDGAQAARRMDVLWLRLSLAGSEQVLPFRIRWTSHIPAMDKVAMLFPLTTYHALLAVHHLPGLKLDPRSLDQWTGGGQSGGRAMAASGYPFSELGELSDCVQREMTDRGLTDLSNVRGRGCPTVRLPLGRRGYELKAAAAEIHAEAWDFLNHDDAGRLWVPCGRLPQSDPLRGVLCRDAQGEASLVPWDATSYGAAFDAVRIYVDDPTRLTGVIDSLLALRNAEMRPVLSIHPMYQDALNRFNLLSDMIANLAPAYALTFTMLLAILLFAQIGTLVDHRRNHYGILMSRGLTWGTIYWKLMFQMLLSCMVGGAMAIFGIVPLFRLLLESGFSEFLGNYTDLLMPEHGLEALPLPSEMVVGTWLGVTGTVLAVAVLLLLRLPLLWSTTPSDLLHTGSLGGRMRGG